MPSHGFLLAAQYYLWPVTGEYRFLMCNRASWKQLINREGWKKKPTVAVSAAASFVHVWWCKLWYLGHSLLHENPGASWNNWIVTYLYQLPWVMCPWVYVFKVNVHSLKTCKRVWIVLLGSMLLYVPIQHNSRVHVHVRAGWLNGETLYLLFFIQARSLSWPPLCAAPL